MKKGRRKKEEEEQGQRRGRTGGGQGEGRDELGGIGGVEDSGQKQRRDHRSFLGDRRSVIGVIGNVLIRPTSDRRERRNELAPSPPSFLFYKIG